MRRALLVVALVASTVLGTLPARAGDDDPWTPLLERVPAAKAYRELLVMNDLTAAREALGLPESRDSTREALHDLVLLSTEGGIAGLPRLFQRDPEDDVRAELGFGITDVRRTAETGVGPSAIAVLDGEFRASTIERAAEADEVWADELETKEHAGTEYLSWDGEDVNPRKITSTRPLGQGGRLALDKGFLWWTSHTKPIEQALEAAAGDRRSLADVRDFARLAEELAALDAYSVLMTGDVLLPGPTREGAPPVDAPGLEPYRALATGAGRDGDDALMLIVLVHADAAAAEANVGRLRTVVEEGASAATGQPWSELLEIDDISANGTVVTARLRTTRPSLWYQVVFQRDLLVTSG